MASKEGWAIGRKTGHSPEIRRVLKGARERDGITARELSLRMGEILRRENPGADNPHINTIYNYERMERDPGVSALAVWSEALGYRLTVGLVDLEEGRDPVLLATDEAVQVGLLVDRMPPETRALLLDLVRRMQD